MHFAHLSILEFIEIIDLFSNDVSFANNHYYYNGDVSSKMVWNNQWY